MHMALIGANRLLVSWAQQQARGGGEEAGDAEQRAVRDAVAHRPLQRLGLALRAAQILVCMQVCRLASPDDDACGAPVAVAVAVTVAVSFVAGSAVISLPMFGVGLF